MTPRDIERLLAGVIAVPPLARRADLAIDAAANRRLGRFLLQAGIPTLLYGGNANVYHLSLGEYEAMLDAVMPLAAEGALVIPGAGPDWGKLQDHAPLLRRYGCPTAMILPQDRFVVPSGVERAIRSFVDAFGNPATLYLRNAAYLPPTAIARLLDDGVVCLVKYAIEAPTTGSDPFLAALLAEAGPTRIVSGDGEAPALVHMFEFGLRTFTSGTVCIAPRAVSRMLEAAVAGDRARAASLREPFMPIDRVRRAKGPTAILHDAVTLAGIADMGPLAPMLANVDAATRATLAPMVEQLTALERAVAEPVR